MRKNERVHSGTGFIVKNGERYFIFTEKGELILCKLNREKYEEIWPGQTAGADGRIRRQARWCGRTRRSRTNASSRNDKEVVCYSLAE